MSQTPCRMLILRNAQVAVPNLRVKSPTSTLFTLCVPDEPILVSYMWCYYMRGDPPGKELPLILVIYNIYLRDEILLSLYHFYIKESWYNISGMDSSDMYTNG